MELWDEFVDRAGLSDANLRSGVLAVSPIPDARPAELTAQPARTSSLLVT